MSRSVFCSDQLKLETQFCARASFSLLLILLEVTHIANGPRVTKWPRVRSSSLPGRQEQEIREISKSKQTWVCCIKCQCTVRPEPWCQELSHAHLCLLPGATQGPGTASYCIKVQWLWLVSLRISGLWLAAYSILINTSQRVFLFEAGESCIHRLLLLQHKAVCK